MFANTKPNTKRVNTTYLERNIFYYVTFNIYNGPFKVYCIKTEKKNPLERNGLNSFFDINNMMGFQMTLLFDSDLNLQMNGSLSIKNLINWSYHRSLKFDPYITSLASEQKAHTAITCIKFNPYNTSITSKPKAHNVIML